MTAFHEVQDVKDELDKIRNASETAFCGVYRSICRMASVVGTVPAVPRVCPRQRHRANV